MTNKLFVGNLAYTITSDQLSQIFAAYGKIVSANVIVDRFSNRSKGFGFVEFETEAEAEAAMKALDGSEQEGRNMVVKEATPRPEREGEASPAPAQTEAPVVEEAPVAEEATEEEAPEVETAEMTEVSEPEEETTEEE